MEETEVDENLCQLNSEAKKSTAFSIRDILGPQQQQEQEQQDEQQEQQQDLQQQLQQHASIKAQKDAVDPNVNAPKNAEALETKVSPREADLSTSDAKQNSQTDNSSVDDDLLNQRSKPLDLQPYHENSRSYTPAPDIHTAATDTHGPKVNQYLHSPRYSQSQKKLQQSNQEAIIPECQNKHQHQLQQHHRHLPQLQQNAHALHLGHNPFYNHNHNDDTHQKQKLCYAREQLHPSLICPDPGDALIATSRPQLQQGPPHQLPMLTLASPESLRGGGSPRDTHSGADLDRENNNNKKNLKTNQRNDSSGSSRYGELRRSSSVDGMGPAAPHVINDSGLPSNLTGRLDASNFMESMRYGHGGRLDPRLDGAVMSQWQQDGCSPIEHHHHHHHAVSAQGSAMLNYNLFTESQAARDMFGCNGK
ncbi:hypothetical protein ElyMa_004241100 [Elysia marginata]|uniref:Uncharacterized protein n=1 Tax=Elysia marginata TaxID=1093978 RepID=A0AAV4GR59_9GAST|nr:hypothetical protein ElyMa_004241100 [Elysia marginata]